ncbi:hypothetical protein L596_017812 [Steinernema carpocapsae]|uniref:Uncharacterized protein n=1 Tax=Steinernema carpocapsae TaxID=34508 RepID=A0A4U5N2R7_STECR|nr:hypothetical protein L596_017812 [Steinernema carpocapsae]
MRPLPLQKTNPNTNALYCNNTAAAAAANRKRDPKTEAAQNNKKSLSSSPTALSSVDCLPIARTHTLESRPRQTMLARRSSAPRRSPKPTLLGAGAKKTMHAHPVTKLRLCVALLRDYLTPGRQTSFVVFGLRNNP